MNINVYELYCFTTVFPQLVSHLRLALPVILSRINDTVLRAAGGFRFALAHRLPSSYGNKPVIYKQATISLFATIVRLSFCFMTNHNNPLRT